MSLVMKAQKEVLMDFKKWECMVCGYIYDEALGDEDHGLAPGTYWADVPDHWHCPVCGVSKDEFEMREI